MLAHGFRLSPLVEKVLIPGWSACILKYLDI